MADRRVHVTFRLATKGVDWVQRLADAHAEKDRSKVYRAALAVARRHEKEVIDAIKEQL